MTRTLRLGYAALAVFFLAFLTRRGLDEVRVLVLHHPRYGFDPASVYLEPKPGWAGQAIRAKLRQELAYLRGCSVLHPDFLPRFMESVARVPWIRDIKAVTPLNQRNFLVRVRFRQPVAKLFGRKRYVDTDGVVLPGAGTPLDLPWIRAQDDTFPDSRQRLIVAREVAFLQDHCAGNGFIWKSLRGIEVASSERRDGIDQVLLTLVFQKGDGSGECRMTWGRGQMDERPGDLSPEAKFQHLCTLQKRCPGWHGIHSGRIEFKDAVVRMAIPALEANGSQGRPPPP